MDELSADQVAAMLAQMEDEIMTDNVPANSDPLDQMLMHSLESMIHQGEAKQNPAVLGYPQSALLPSMTGGRLTGLAHHRTPIVQKGASMAPQLKWDTVQTSAMMKKSHSNGGEVYWKGVPGETQIGGLTAEQLMAKQQMMAEAAMGQVKGIRAHIKQDIFANMTSAPPQAFSPQQFNTVPLSIAPSSLVGHKREREDSRPVSEKTAKSNPDDTPAFQRISYKSIYAATDNLPPPPPPHEWETALSPEYFMRTLECYLRMAKPTQNNAVNTNGVLIKIPSCEGRAVNLYHLYWLVVSSGGEKGANDKRSWKAVFSRLGHDANGVNASKMWNGLKRYYSAVLKGLEEHYHPPGSDALAKAETYIIQGLDDDTEQALKKKRADEIKVVNTPKQQQPMWQVKQPAPQPTITPQTMASAQALANATMLARGMQVSNPQPMMQQKMMADLLRKQIHQQEPSIKQELGTPPVKSESIGTPSHMN
jgi:hypothetical protein